jgi:hypothetical protein
MKTMRLLKLAFLTSTFALFAFSQDVVFKFSPDSVYRPSRNVRFKCSPDTVWLGDTLTLKMSVPHGGDLGMTTPQKEFYFLVQRAETESPPRSILPSEQFETLRELKIITDKTKMWLYVAGSTENQIAFSRTGKYTFRLSDNLETDDGTPVFKCSVYYINRKRK